MKVCVLQPSYKDSSSIIKDLDLRRNLTPWIPQDWTVEHIFIDKSRVVEQILHTHADDYVNFCGKCFHKRLCVSQLV